MSKFQEINAARPGKIVEMLDTIQRSANSQKATPQEVATLIAPVSTQLRNMLSGVPYTPPVSHALPGVDVPETETETAPVSTGQMAVARWHDIDTMVEDLNIHEVERAMSKLLVRMSDFIYEKEGGQFS